MIFISVVFIYIDIICFSRTRQHIVKTHTIEKQIFLYVCYELHNAIQLQYLLLSYQKVLKVGYGSWLGFLVLVWLLNVDTRKLVHVFQILRIRLCQWSSFIDHLSTPLSDHLIIRHATHAPLMVPKGPGRTHVEIIGIEGQFSWNHVKSLCYTFCLWRNSFTDRYVYSSVYALKNCYAVVLNVWHVIVVLN